MSSPWQPYLTDLYGSERAPEVAEHLERLINEWRTRLPVSTRPGRQIALSERDALLITYGDQVSTPGEPPLRTLATVCAERLTGLVSGVHILPFYPWTSDDGFSVVDYRAIDPALGAWADVRALAGRFRLMFDGVINHVSASSEWFQGFLRDDPKYREYFIVVEGDPDLSQVVRPRALPLLTPVTTAVGEKKVWTTFSADQIDVNAANPDVLLELIDVLLLYASEGADFIRLDAIAYLWKEIGTTCIHLPQTHRAIQLIRAVLDATAPHVALITETNVPHIDNISYFGDGRNEAQLVYNFALPPLTLHTLRTGNASALRDWAATLALPSRDVTFFNFLASHDGIGLNPARGILPQADIDALVQRTLDHGGLISSKHNADGTQSPYEMNINYFDALSDPSGSEPIERQAARFMAAQAIMLMIVGMPGIYFHSLFGSRGWPAGVGETGRNRTINREKLSYERLTRELAEAGSLRNHVYSAYAALLRARSSTPAFHPLGGQEVVDAGKHVFALWRTSPDGKARVLALQNVTASPRSCALADLGLPGSAHELITGVAVPAGSITLEPYQTLWLLPAP